MSPHFFSALTKLASACSDSDSPAAFFSRTGDSARLTGDAPPSAATSLALRAILAFFGERVEGSARATPPLSEVRGASTDSRAAPVVRLLRTVRSAGSDTSGAQAVGISGQPSSAPSSASSSIVFLVLFSCRTSDGPRVACSLLAAASQRA